MTVAESIETRRELPRGWRWVKLGELCEFTYGVSLPETKRKSGPVPVYGSNGIVGFHEEALTNGPCLIIGRKGSIGEVHYSPVPCWPIDTTYFVEFTRDDIDFSWLYNVLKSLNMGTLNKAAAIPGLNRQDAYNLDVPLPPLPEQRRIAAILNEQMAAVERARAAAEARLEAARALPAAYLREVFESEEARGWKRVALARVCSIGTGTTPSTNNPEYYRGTIPFVKTAEVVNNRIFAAETHISSKAVRDFNMRLYPKGTVLLAMYGQGKTRGQVGLLEIDATTTQNAAAIVPGEQLDSEYLWLWLQSLYENLRRMGFQGDLSHLSLGYIKALEVPLPSVVVQRRVVAALLDYLKSTEVAITSLQAQLDTINTLSAALLRQAFNGEL